MQFKESLSEASREGGGGLSDATLRTSQLSGEAAEEVVLCLLAVEDAYWRQYAKGVGTQEDYLLGGRTLAGRALDILDVVDGVTYAGVLGDALVGEVNLAVLVHGHVLEQCVAADGVVDVGL